MRNCSHKNNCVPHEKKGCYGDGESASTATPGSIRGEVKQWDEDNHANWDCRGSANKISKEEPQFRQLHVGGEGDHEAAHTDDAEKPEGDRYDGPHDCFRGGQLIVVVN